MIDDEEAVPNDGNTGDLSGEPDFAKVTMIQVPIGAAMSASSMAGGARIIDVSFPGAERPLTPTDRVLYKVRKRREEHDARDGYFRDFKDGTGRPNDAHDVLAATSAHDEALKVVRVTWRHKLMVALALALAETNEKKLADRLVEVAAVVTAWQEAVELRGSKARILAEQGAVRHVQRADGTWKKVNLMPWWRRLLKALHIV